MIILAHAKVNLTLYITGRDKKDGYHYIESVFDPVSLCDVLEIKPLKSREIRLVQSGNSLDIAPEKNLVYRAAVMLQKASKTKKGAFIILHKRIPDGAGLGGGSSDAAAVLRGLNRLWGLKWDVNKLKKLAFKLGSDVPFFIESRPAIVSGKGEKIRPFRRPAEMWYVIAVKKGVKIPTPEAYNWYDKDLKLTSGQNRDIIVSRLMRESINSRLTGFLHNDFEAPVFKRRKKLAKLKAYLQKCGNTRNAQMSGSGSAVFAVFNNQDQALSCYKKAKKGLRGSFICLAHSI
ncbi:MAG TPA: 4-(cytidine 5'-diphospho)-2-C-methyl-D-erythritol kinase [Candidatus Goldiibacteriota bacterium]|nr:4-(cytidine 5'-diphospho)-2-C-methyl-D-erythritol kinase [Candidatus Goldiibacteriota bacterium]